jgi:hypothetical protein
MIYIVNKLKKHTNLTDEQVKDVVKVLKQYGYYNSTIENYNEMTKFYLLKREEAIECGYPIKIALLDTAEHFKVSTHHLRKLVRVFKKLVE